MPYVEHDGAEIYYETHGEGPALVFAHGAEGNTLSWFQQVPVFKAHYCTVLYDHRGFGRSICAPADLQPSKFGGDLLAVMDALAIERAAVVAQSMAGWGALQAVLAAPERISALVLVATSGGLAPPAGSGEAPVENAAPLAGRLSRFALAPGYPVRAPAMAWLFDQISCHNGQIELLASRLGANLIDPKDMAGFAVPTLVIACGHDTFFPPSLLESVSAMIPGARFATIETAGHAPYWETPGAFNEMVLAFLESRRSRR
ncbi:MAG: alpha/beta fold hydrolase [Alphaproteobacteria bacterium]